MGTSFAIILLFLLIPAVVLVTIVSLIFKGDKIKTGYVLTGITAAAIIMAVTNSLVTGSVNQSNIIVFLLLTTSLLLSVRINNKRRRDN